VVCITVWNVPRTVDRASRTRDTAMVMANVLSANVSRERRLALIFQLDREEQAEQAERDHLRASGQAPVHAGGSRDIDRSHRPASESPERRRTNSPTAVTELSGLAG
jgi:hypothetical protein